RGGRSPAGAVRPGRSGGEVCRRGGALTHGAGVPGAGRGGAGAVPRGRERAAVSGLVRNATGAVGDGAGVRPPSGPSSVLPRDAFRVDTHGAGVPGRGCGEVCLLAGLAPALTGG